VSPFSSFAPGEGATFLLIEKMEVGAFAANCYLVACSETKEGVIIDPGAEGKQVVKKAGEMGMAVKYIINTHGHIDHVGSNGEVKKAFAVPVLVHEKDAPMFRSPQASLALFTGKGKLPAPDQTFRNGDVFSAGRLSIQVLETPGHTPGSVTLDIQGRLFTGDTLFAGSIGRTDLPGGSYQQIIASIKSKILVYNDDTEVYPGHGSLTTVGEERQFNPFLS